jgi:hypothetical protein
LGAEERLLKSQNEFLNSRREEERDREIERKRENERE